MQNLEIDCNIKASIIYYNTNNKKDIFSKWVECKLVPKKLHDHTRGEVYVFQDKTVIRIGGNHTQSVRAFSDEKSKSIIRLFSKVN